MRRKGYEAGWSEAEILIYRGKLGSEEKIRIYREESKAY